MAAVSVEETEVFVASVDAQLQVVRVSSPGAGSARVHVEGTGLDTPTPLDLALEGQVTAEVGVDTRGATPGTTLPARAGVTSGTDRVAVAFRPPPRPPPPRRLRPRPRPPRPRAPRAGVQVRARRGRLPQAVLGHLPRRPRGAAPAPRRGPRRGHGRHLQRAEHEPDRPRDDRPQLRPRHGFPA